MEEKKIDRILKFLYFLVGVKIAVFAFVISLLIDVPYKPVNMILSISLTALIVGIFILGYFIISLIFKPEMLEIKTTRDLVGFMGVLVGLIFASMMAWILMHIS